LYARRTVWKYDITTEIVSGGVAYDWSDPVAYTFSAKYLAMLRQSDFRACAQTRGLCGGHRIEGQEAQA